MFPTYPIVKVQVTIVFQGLRIDDISSNLLEVIRRAVARILKIPTNRVVITNYGDSHRLMDYTTRVLEDEDSNEGLC